MRLLPRSAKGTWLLAGAAWLAFCIPVWWLLPPVPRALALLPVGARLLGFGPDCATAVVLRALPLQPGRSNSSQALILWDTATGQPLATLLDGTRSVEVLGKSHDGKTWLLADYGLDDDRLVQLNLPTRRLKPLTLSSKAVEQCFQDRLSADGRFAAICCPAMGLASRDPDKHGLFLWDAVAGKQAAFFDRVDPPFEFSGDGRWLTAAIPGRSPRCIGVIDLHTLQVRETQIPASNMPFDRGCLSDDGSYLAQCLSVGEGRELGDEAFKTSCWNLATGAEVVRITGTPFGRLAFSHDGQLLHLTGSLYCYDVANGGRKTERFSNFNGNPDLSSDGRYILTTQWAVPPWRRLIRALGLKWDLGRDEKAFGEVFDTTTWSNCGIIPGKSQTDYYSKSMPRDLGWGPDGRTLAAQDETDLGRWYIWDIPPRKPLTWFALAAAMLALPIAGLAWRWSRRLRREVA